MISKLSPKYYFIPIFSSFIFSYKSLTFNESLQSNKTFNNKYKIIKEINKGSQGIIYLGYDNYKKINIAIKKYNTPLNNTVTQHLIANQTDISTNTGIIKIFDVINSYLITEYIDGLDLYEFIKKTKTDNISNDLILNIALELCLALINLKKQKIIHCDLKPDNIIINKYNKPIIIDFDSAILNDTNICTNINKKNITFTYSYQPPEFYKYNIINYDSDVWALGCILYILITKQHPFDLHNLNLKHQIIDNILYKNVLFIQPIWLTIPIELQSIINNMLNKNPENRLSIEIIYERLKKIKL